MDRLLGLRLALTISMLALVTTSCQKQQVTDQNLVEAGDPNTDRIIGDSTSEYRIMGNQAISDGVKAGTIFLSSSARARKFLSEVATPGARAPRARPSVALTNADNLVFGYPVDLLKKEQLFGAVFTAVSDRTNENMGQLKLTDLPALHATTEVVKVSETEYVLAISACIDQCTADSVKVPLAPLPIVGIDEPGKKVLLDLSVIAEDLNLVAILDPTGEGLSLKTKSAKTMLFDFSDSTLVFDIEATMIPRSMPIAAPSAPITRITARWYLKLLGSVDPNFNSRQEAEGVGFFMTERAATSVIERFSAARFPIKYFVKNVPAAFRPAFREAFEDWNQKFRAAVGKNVFAYEFLEATDPRTKRIVTGDIRYNVVEWDLVNVAPYGGLGPSIANQLTGEILSSNVLVQGPKIVELYTKWFDSTDNARELREMGLVAAADAVMKKSRMELVSEMERLRSLRFSVSLGEQLPFRIPAQNPKWEDPLDERMDFEEVPVGMTFDRYMRGYFRELLAHELGHNVGLRHNFRGNLSFESMVEGKVSHSIMEYLGRGYRHLNRISKYDTMAIGYGYLGTPPAQTNLFCSDEGVVSPRNLEASPECSKEDATSDPFGYFDTQLKHAVNLLILPESNEASDWTVAEMDSDLSPALHGLALYAATVDKTLASWTNFAKTGRPTGAEEIKAFVKGTIVRRVCDRALDEAVQAKATALARETTRKNLADLREKAIERLESLPNFSADDLACE